MVPDQGTAVGTDGASVVVVPPTLLCLAISYASFFAHPRSLSGCKVNDVMGTFGRGSSLIHSSYRLRTLRRGPYFSVLRGTPTS